MSLLLNSLERLYETAMVLVRDQKLKGMTSVVEKQLAAAFQKQGAEFLKRLAAKRGQFTATEPRLREGTAEDLGFDHIFTEAEVATLEVFEEPIAALTKAAVEAGARVAIVDLGLDASFDLPNPRAEAFLKGRAAERVTMINSTTREQMRALLTQAMENGWSYDKTARAIKEQFDGFAGKRPQQHIRNRAQLVAVQEAGEAYEAGSYMVGQELQSMGLVMEKSWLTVGDVRVSDLCRGNQAAGWIPMNQPFPSGHERPLGHVACRCTLLQQRAKGAVKKQMQPKPARTSTVPPVQPMPTAAVKLSMPRGYAGSLDAIKKASATHAQNSRYWAKDYDADRVAEKWGEWLKGNTEVSPAFRRRLQKAVDECSENEVFARQVAKWGDNPLIAVRPNGPWGHQTAGAVRMREGFTLVHEAPRMTPHRMSPGMPSAEWLGEKGMVRHEYAHHLEDLLATRDPVLKDKWFDLCVDIRTAQLDARRNFIEEQITMYAGNAGNDEVFAEVFTIVTDPAYSEFTVGKEVKPLFDFMEELLK